MLLQNGLKMERKLGLNSGTTALNLASVCFSMKKPKKSLSYAQLAISENMLKLKNVSDLLEDEETRNIGKVLVLSFMACSKALRNLGFPKKAVNQLQNAEGILEKLCVEEEDLLRRTITVQLENACKEEMTSEKFDVRSLSIDSKRGGKRNFLNRTAGSNLYSSVDRANSQTSRSELYFYGSNKPYLIRSKEMLKISRGHNPQLSKTTDFSKLQYGDRRAKISGHKFRVSNRNWNKSPRSRSRANKNSRERYLKTHSGNFRSKNRSNSPPKSQQRRLQTEEQQGFNVDGLDDVFLKATGCIIEDEPVQKNEHQNEPDLEKFKKNERNQQNSEEQNLKQDRSEEVTQLKLKHPKSREDLKLSKGSLQKIEEIDTEAERKIHEIQIEREKRRLEIINQRGLLLKQRVLKRQNSILKQNQSKDMSAIEEIEHDSNRPSNSQPQKMSDFDLQLKKEEENLIEQQKKAAKRLKRELDLLQELNEVDKMKKTIKNKKKDNKRKVQKKKQTKLNNLREKKKQQEELELRILKQKLKEKEQVKRCKKAMKKVRYELEDKLKHKRRQEEENYLKQQKMKLQKIQDGKTNFSNTIQKREGSRINNPSHQLQEVYQA